MSVRRAGCMPPSQVQWTGFARDGFCQGEIAQDMFETLQARGGPHPRKDN